jgi:hypothetical protein
VKLYVFDGVDDKLELVPLAARRAHDHVGRKVSLEAWKSLSLEVRGLIVEAGSASKLNGELVRAAIRKASPEPLNIDPVKDPSAASVPVVGAHPARPLRADESGRKRQSRAHERRVS